MAAPNFMPLLTSIDFSTASAAVLQALALLAGFGIVLKGGLAVLENLGLVEKKQSLDEYYNGLDEEGKKEFWSVHDEDVRRSRRKRHREMMDED